MFLYRRLKVQKGGAPAAIGRIKNEIRGAPAAAQSSASPDYPAIPDRARRRFACLRTGSAWYNRKASGTSFTAPDRTPPVLLLCHVARGAAERRWRRAHRGIAREPVIAVGAARATDRAVVERDVIVRQPNR